MSREKRKAKKEAEKRLSTRQFIGAKEITDYSLVTYGQGELVYFIVKSNDYLKKSPVYGHFRKTAA